VKTGFVVDAARAAWLTLALMMLLSRIAFQVAGPRRMRTFLDGWQSGSVKRLWGMTALGFAGFIAVSALTARGSFTKFEVALVAMLVAVLAADGLLNSLPSGFETFKDRLQAAWVRRARGGWEGDLHLFGAVNALLAALSVAVVGVVIAYRPIEAAPIVAAVVAAVVLTSFLIAASALTAAR